MWGVRWVRTELPELSDSVGLQSCYEEAPTTETVPREEASVPQPAEIPQTGGRTPMEMQEKSATAAKHTYDIGYGKWDKFDVDGELRKVDRAALRDVHS